MNICKSSLHNTETTEQSVDMTIINTMARREMTQDEVYTFAVRLCDNEVDRDFERFSDECLEELAELFIGKTGLLDHDWTASGQMARIYRCEVVTDSATKNSENQPYKYLKGWAYMPRTEGTAEFIEAIDSGIVKETSVGCSVGLRSCSICGKTVAEGCAHIGGREYDGKVCHSILSAAIDAYEWSFVAVPAQKNAGVIKAFGGVSTLKELIKTPQGRAFADEFEALEREARQTKSLMADMRAEVSRLCLLWDEGMFATMKKSIGNMDAAELIDFKSMVEDKLSGKFPALCQLPGANSEVRFVGEDYLI